LGSGTTSVVAKKLGRHYVGIEQALLYACLAQKRLALVEGDGEAFPGNRTIQGYTDGYFWERNVSVSDRMASP
jgi:site-specific DNA-methyltransferase (adenine-specific)